MENFRFYLLTYLPGLWYNRAKEVILMISTRGRYSIRILLDLAEHSAGGYVPMKEVAKRQEISLKYIEKIMPLLRNGGLLDSSHGIGGGYRLAKDPGDITLWEILSLAEGDMAPVSCLGSGAPICPRAAGCKTLPVWKGYYELTEKYFSGITLADLAGAEGGNDYMI